MADAASLFVCDGAKIIKTFSMIWVAGHPPSTALIALMSTAIIRPKIVVGQQRKNKQITAARA
jgi:hypothetical protein